MALWISQRKEQPRPCSDCGLEFPQVTGFVLDAGGPRAVYFASCHSHVEGGAARVDVVLGTWGSDPPAGDHVTFGCELRPSGAMVLDAPATTSQARPVMGTALTRADALAHPLADEFREILDLVATEDPAVILAVHQIG